MKVDQDPGHQTPGRIHSKQNRSFSAAVNGLVTNRNMRSVWKIPVGQFNLQTCANCSRTCDLKQYRRLLIHLDDEGEKHRICSCGKWDAWVSHFAVFPPDLVRPIVKAASAVQCCAGCGAPYAPVVKRGEANRAQQRACGGDADGHYNGTATKEFALHGAQNASAVKARILAGMVAKEVTGYRATCTCGLAETVPAVGLDPFAGSGTVGEVCIELGRAVILIEISRNYGPLIRRRCEVMAPLL